MIITIVMEYASPQVQVYETMKKDCELLAICNQTKYNEEKEEK